MNKDLIETPRYNFFIGNEVLLKGKIVGFNVDENRYVENVVRLEYGQTLNAPNSAVYIADDIVDKSKIKVTIPQFVADFITEQKKLGYTLSYSIDASMSDRVAEWYWDNSELFALAWILGHKVKKEKRYTVVMKETKQPLYYNAGDKKLFFSLGDLATNFTRKQLEEAGFGEVFNSPLFEVLEVE